ncbi:hypothetical protein [Achromobacter denitrificans]|uniref:hypothetical protein n=1 Tax=Achromobacter denitrificans TaxID=32002 RepID=UPI0012F92A6E|nr:hypothetical protein [Achromobacter denitrificans]
MEEQRKIINLDATQIAALKLNAVRDRFYAARISIALAIRLLDRSDPFFNPFSVLDELDYLEGMRATSRTKPEAPFKDAALQPFYHKHFSSSKHLLKNLDIRWNLANGGNRDLDRMIRDVAKEFGENHDQWVGNLAHRLVMEGYMQRVKRGLTGDWIIFAKHEGVNYYLDLATHEEGLGEQAAELAKKLRDGSAADFPFLFEQ